MHAMCYWELDVSSRLETISELLTRKSLSLLPSNGVNPRLIHLSIYQSRASHHFSAHFYGSETSMHSCQMKYTLKETQIHIGFRNKRTAIVSKTENEILD